LQKNKLVNLTVKEVNELAKILRMSMVYEPQPAAVAVAAGLLPLPRKPEA